MATIWKRTATKLLDLAFPPLCMACRGPVAAPGLCADCWGGIAFLDGPLCACCGIPFEVGALADMRCAVCLAKPPAFDKARAVLRYDEASRGPILALKHADRLELVPDFAVWLHRAGHEILAGSDLIVPVPLHPARLWARRYNQAAELARALARQSGIGLDTCALVRARSTPSQGVMVSAKARRRNMLGAFRVRDAARVTGRNLVLVDDVMTTGATADACARALKRAGARKVAVLALARVVRAAEMPI